MFGGRASNMARLSKRCFKKSINITYFEYFFKLSSSIILHVETLHHFSVYIIAKLTRTFPV